MDYAFVLKAGFMGFALSLGCLLLVFYVAGTMLKISQRRFVRVFVLAGIVSFAAVDAYLYYKIRVRAITPAQLFLVGCIGGWIGGIFFGLINARTFLMSALKPDAR